MRPKSRLPRILHAPARMLLVVLLVGALALPAMPIASAQISNPTESTPTSLYFHVFDTFNPFPINTQPMNADFFDVGGSSFPSMRSQGYEFNSIRGYSTPGPVEYDFIENGRPRFHPERGISANVEIDDQVQPVVYLYMELRDAIGLKSMPTALPTFTFKVTLREGDNLRADLDAGAVIMDGSLSAHVVDARFCPEDLGDIAGDGTSVPVCERANDAFAGQTGPDGLPILTPDAAGVVEFAIPMNLQKSVIPKTEAFNVRIDWYQDMGGAMAEEDFSTGFLRLVSDPEHLPRLDLAVKNPVYIDFIHPQVAGGVLLIHTGVNSPWGTYDVDVENMTMRVEGPTAPQNLERVATLNQHVHNAHDQAAEITYLWRFRDEGAAEGDYKIHFEVPNLAGNAVATGTAGFTIEGARAFGVSDEGEVVEPAAVDDEEDGKGVPGPAPVLVPVAALGAALLARRWRR